MIFRLDADYNEVVDWILTVNGFKNGGSGPDLD